MGKKSGLKIYSLNKSFLETFISELDCYTEEELHDLFIILPTQRLAPYLLALLAKKRKVFFAPSILSLEAWLQTQSDKVQETVLSSSAEELLVASLLKKHKFLHLQKGHEHEIRELFSQIDQVQLGRKAFRKWKSYIQNDIYKDDSHRGTLIERIEELEKLYDLFKDLLSQKGLCTREDYAVQSANSLLNFYKGKEEVDCRHIYFAGFTTVKAYCRPLLKELLSKDRVNVLLSSSPPLISKQNPLEDLQRYLGGFSEKESGFDIPLEKERTFVYQCDSILIEVENAIRTVHFYLEKSCPPSAIGILLTNEKVYGPVLRHYLEKESFLSNMAIAENFAKSSLGSWLLRLCHYLVIFSASSREEEKKKEAPQAFYDFLNHPFTKNQFLKSFSDSSGESRKTEWRRFQKLVRNSQFYHGSERADLLIMEEGGLQKLTALVADLLDLARKRKTSVREWQVAFSEILLRFNILDAFSQWLIEDLKTSEKEAFLELMEDIEHWGLCWDESIPPIDFLYAIIEKIHSKEIRSIGFPLQGVQVLNVVEARYVPFEVMIIVGAMEGYFPRALPNDKLIGDKIKSSIGLPSWDYVEALEDTTFHLLCTQAKYYHFFYTQNSDHSSLFRSRFIEQILKKDKAQFKRCFFQKEVPQNVYEQTKLGEYLGPREDLFSTISASSLSELFRCPYRFLLKSLGVKKKEELSQALWEGRWLHQIVEAFYTGYVADEYVLEALTSRVNLKKNEIYNFAFQRFEKLTHHVLPDSVLGSPFYLHLMHFSWPRFIKHWEKFFEPAGEGLWTFSLETSYKELSIAGKGFSLGEEKTSLLGSVDSLDLFSKGHILVDYKRKHMEPVKDVVKALAPQLPLYAWALSQNRFRHSKEFLKKTLVAYWSLIEGRWQACGVGEEARSWALEKSLVTRQTPDVEDLLSNLEAQWEKSIEGLLHNGEAFQAVESEACTFCEYSGVCKLGTVPSVPQGGTDGTVPNGRSL